MKNLSTAIAVFSVVWGALGQNSTSTGKWSDPDTWGGAMPGDDAEVTINNGHSVTIDVDANAASITLNQDASLIIPNNVTLTITNTFNLSGLNASLTVEEGGVLELAISGEVRTIGNSVEIIVAGTLNAYTTLELGANDAEMYVTSSGILYVEEDLILGSNDTNIIVEGMLMTGGISARFSNAGIAVAEGGVVTVGGDVDLSDSSLDIHEGGQLEISGDLTIDNSSEVNVDEEGLLAVEGTVGSNVDNEISISDEGDCSVDPITGATLCGTTTLPVELLYFKHEVIGSLTVLTWATLVEINNDFFTIERSYDGKNYVKEVFVQGAGNTNQIEHYESAIRNLNDETVYFRLKQTDFDGTEEVIGIIRVPSDNWNKAVFYPNPTNGALYIQHSTDGMLTVRSLKGEVLLSFPSTGLDHIDLSETDLPAGVYLVGFEEDIYRDRIQFIKD